ncbi:protein arginine N-methyltransferase [Capsaspora owczarzaki ATCC 30864]|uniref:Protein arginine N-methyltransferase n=1 Tax=Capsaspora owczarzaki (strain ATCC 30864) TaxID=595528 RepID=A0A0D2X4T1_CAPO3|nr:protein arginine N-methyltransferase [Capsaspora owczarzaki ATCC 30864]KJE96599.1 protein arginine N-methyltransferase [Capsaspora owczarzaki ATCC 30864]|eukprot:XP_004344520.1 protein arginine N-methyltransferase [Capsaspora owczarzaki ATCC 30864]
MSATATGATTTTTPDTSDAPYFKSYASIHIHEDMIRDEARTATYRRAIFALGDRIRGKAVCDVGAGTGILSVFCAQAGARKVYAIEASDMAKQARLIVMENNVQDTVQVIHGRVEDVDLPEKVDVIVSEWMGYFLFYESMFESVLLARDRWLNKDTGLMLPSAATLYMCPVHEPYLAEEKVAFWSTFPKERYGISMASLGTFAKQCLHEEVAIDPIEPEQCLAWPVQAVSIDCNTLTLAELRSISGTFAFRAIVSNEMHAIAAWFDVEFPCFSDETDGQAVAQPESSDRETAQTTARKRVRLEQTEQGTKEPIVLSTSPDAPPTHWRQTLFRLLDPVPIQQDDIIAGSVRILPDEQYKRFLGVQLSLKHKGNSILENKHFRLTDGSLAQ